MMIIEEGDLEQIAQAAEAVGYRAKKIVGGYMLIRPEQQSAEAVHLVFAGEKSRTTQPLPHAQVRPEDQDLFGISVPVAPLPDLVQMKLTSFRRRDLVHLQTLDECGLITRQIEGELPAALPERLKQARKQFAEDQPDVDA